MASHESTLRAEFVDVELLGWNRVLVIVARFLFCCVVQEIATVNRACSWNASVDLSSVQKTIAPSSGEAEYHSLSSGLFPGKLVFKVVLEFFSYPVTMSAFCDSRAASGIARRCGVG